MSALKRKQIRNQLQEVCQRVWKSLNLAVVIRAIRWSGKAWLSCGLPSRSGWCVGSEIDGYENTTASGSWVSRQNVRQVVHGRDQQFTFEQLLLPQQNAEQWRMARRDFVRALILCPLDDDVRVSLVELDMVIPGADSKSADLLTQAASLRPQHKQFLDYLSWLAKDEPGPAVQRKIEELRLPPDKKK